MHLQAVHQVAKCVVSMLSCTVTCVFLYLVPVQSARYDSPNNLSLLPADTQHNNTKRLNYVIKFLFDSRSVSHNLNKKNHQVLHEN